MHIQNVPFEVVDWRKLHPSEHPGETGVAYWYTRQIGDIRVRLVEYSPGYLADHWCRKGHILTVLAGTLETELEKGETVTLTTGMSYLVEDESSSHRSRTETGATLLIVD
jgi:quercetin dioxygenase-like cupin family protein